MRLKSSIKGAGNRVLPRAVLPVVAWAIQVLTGPGTMFADDFENVRLRLANGSSIRATIESIDSDGELVGSQLLENVVLGQIVEVDTGREIGKSSSDHLVMQVGGGQIPFADLRLDGESVKVLLDGKPLELAVSLVKAVVWKSNPLVDSTVAERSAGSDSVIVQTKNGPQVVRGVIESVDDTHVNIHYGGESRRIGLAKVMAIVPAAIETTPARGVTASVHLVDGSIVVGAISQYRDGVLQLALSDSQSIEFPAQSVARVAIVSDRIAWLSDLEPIQVEMQSQFSAARPWQRDRSLLGNPLRLKFNSSGKVLEFEKGIGARSYSSLVFANRSANNSRFNQLRAVVGIDVETSGRGDCEMVVEGDGIQLWSKRVLAGDDPESIVVEIGDINEIALIVRPGGNFDLADHADWADARLIRTD